MNLFRSEEHARRWRDGGAIVPVATLCRLAHAWWADRLAPDWRPHTREQNAAILERLGLVGEFWALAQSVRPDALESPRHEPL